ncbi:MAG: tRNA (guanosine(46)-N7)-methyltransferase TrmB [Fulvivirga sp.]
MSRAKLKRFAEVAKRHNVLEPGKEMYEKIKGQWNSYQFKNENPITIELACGRGEYSVGLARMFPEQDFIGIDIKGDRIWKGSSMAIEEQLENVAFLRTIIQLLEKFFAPDEVSEIWITFPDPRPKDRDEKRRLTNNRFLDIYKNVIKKDGWVRLKTDNTELFEYSLEVIKGRKDIRNLEYTFDVYNSALEPDCHGIKTRYEKKHAALGADIKYLKFQFT